MSNASWFERHTDKLPPHVLADARASAAKMAAAAEAGQLPACATAVYDGTPSTPSTDAQVELIRQHVAFFEKAAEATLGFGEQAQVDELVASFDVSTDEQRCVSADGTEVRVRVHRPRAAGDRPLPFVYYTHGGGMLMFSLDSSYVRVTAARIAAHGVGVVAVDFRNSHVKPFPAGVDDCVAGLAWLVANGVERCGWDGKNLTVFGESGGGNLALGTFFQARKNEKTAAAAAVTRMLSSCPVAANVLPADAEADLLWPPSSLERLRGQYTNSPDEARNSSAWPAEASDDELLALPRTEIILYELDPLLSEGRAFFRRLVRAGHRNATAHMRLSATHGAEQLGTVECTESVRHDFAAYIASFASQPATQPQTPHEPVIMATKKGPKSHSGNTRAFYDQFQTTSKFIQPAVKPGGAAPPPSKTPAKSPSKAPAKAPSKKKADNYAFPTLRNQLPPAKPKAKPKAAAGGAATAKEEDLRAELEEQTAKTEELIEQFAAQEEQLEKEIVELHELLKQSLDETDQLVEQLRVSDEKLAKNKKLLKEILSDAKRFITAKEESEKERLEKKFASLYLTSRKK